MNNKKVILAWIDDNKKHKADADILMERNNKLRIEFFHPEEFLKIEEKKEVDIFLIDFKLNQYPLDGTKYRGDGLYFSGFVKSKYPDIPIYWFSSDPYAEIYGKLAYISWKEADFILEDYRKIQDNGDEIFYYDALDYQKIRNVLSEKLDSLIDLLSPPDEEREKIMGLIPHILKTKEFERVKTQIIAGKALDFAVWVRDIFMKYPGFLYNSLYSATSLGMTRKAFEEKTKTFESALYKGIFSRTSEEKLWWKTSLFNVIIQSAKKTALDNITSDIKKTSAQLFDLKEEETSKCVICGEKYPDALGVIQEVGERKPVHLRCSRRNPNETRMLFFDELRLI